MLEVGGTFDYAALLAKKSLLRPLGTKHIDPDTANLENEMFGKDQQFRHWRTGGWVAGLQLWPSMWNTILAT